MPETTVSPMPARKPGDFITPAALRALLKQSGFNARQVSVSKHSSIRYLDVTVRDPNIDYVKLRAIIATFNTWSMDVSDYVTGQSIDIRTTREVDAAWAAQYVNALRAAIVKMTGADASPIEMVVKGVSLALTREGFYLSRTETPFNRKPFHNKAAVESLDESVFRVLGAEIHDLLHHV